MKMTTKTIKNVKDLPRGSGNRVADGAKLLQEGNDPADHAHVGKQTPLETKRKEMLNDERYRTELAPDTNKIRERRTTAKRRDKETRPL
jgi:hypothetical protein